MLLVDEHRWAQHAIFGLVVAGVVAESIATGRTRGDRPPSTGELDRGTKGIVVLATLGGILLAAFVAADVPSLRIGANSWATYALGLLVLAAGMGFRVWAVLSLGPYFRREVTIEQGQTVHTSGPYRWIRHPAYLGDLLIVFGIGLAAGSWIGAIAGTAVAFVGHLPRIRVEERELWRAFGEDYERFARGRARLVPGVW